MTFGTKGAVKTPQIVQFVSGVGDAVGATPLFFGNGTHGDATAGNVGRKFMVAGTLSNLRARATTGAATTGTIALAIAGVAGALTTSFGAAVTRDDQLDDTHSMAVAAGDQVTALGTRTGGANSLTPLNVEALFTPT